MGLSFGVNIADYGTATRMNGGAGIGAADDVTLAATTDHQMATLAKSGAKASGEGKAIAGSVAVAVSMNDTTSEVQVGGGLIELDGNLTITATSLVQQRTESDSDTKGGDTGVGIAIALGWIEDDTNATLARDVSAAAAQANAVTVAAASGATAATVASGSSEVRARTARRAAPPPTRKPTRRRGSPSRHPATTRCNRPRRATRSIPPTARPVPRPATRAGRAAPRRTPPRNSRVGPCGWPARSAHRSSGRPSALNRRRRHGGCQRCAERQRPPTTPTPRPLPRGWRTRATPTPPWGRQWR